MDTGRTGLSYGEVPEGTTPPRRRNIQHEEAGPGGVQVKLRLDTLSEEEGRVKDAPSWPR